MIKKTRQQVIDDGAEADRLLNTELPRFMDELEAEIWEEFKKSDPSDKDGREVIFGRACGIENVKTMLHRLKQNATIEKNRK
jgi:hypothetical protein